MIGRWTPLSVRRKESLRRGDIVTNQGSGDSYVVLDDALPGRPIIAIRSVEVYNEDEWSVFHREDFVPQEPAKR